MPVDYTEWVSTGTRNPTTRERKIDDGLKRRRKGWIKHEHGLLLMVGSLCLLVSKET